MFIRVVDLYISCEPLQTHIPLSLLYSLECVEEAEKKQSRLSSGNLPETASSQESYGRFRKRDGGDNLEELELIVKWLFEEFGDELKEQIVRALVKEALERIYRKAKKKKGRI